MTAGPSPERACRSSRGSRWIARSFGRLAISALFVAAAIGANSRVASADPSVWARARNPEVDVEANALAEAEVLVRKYAYLESRQIGAAFREMGLLFVKEARKKLEQAGAATSRDPMMRFRLAELLSILGDHEQAAALLEYALRSPTLLPPVRAAGLGELAICYARMGRPRDEINAYTEALSLTAVGQHRALLLANRAEANMVIGDLTKAIEGYRAALSSLLPIEMFSRGVTTLWGLGVALDRSGDLESGLAAIRLAREYDGADRQINDDGWFYVPAYDSDWYAALGYWSRARQAMLSMSRAEAYERAIDSWQSYIERAPETDQWLPIAKVRLRACEQERDASVAKSKPEAGAGRPRPRPPRAMPTKL